VAKLAAAPRGAPAAFSSLFGWLVYSERKVLLAGCWFVVREKYCWLVADKPSEQGAGHLSLFMGVGGLSISLQKLAKHRIC
jgi:hypothetical protein